MLVLASQSPRRAQLLKQIGVAFSQSPVDIDETPLTHEAPNTYVTRMATEKSRIGWHRNQRQGIVLGADTIVVANSQILGKPADKADFEAMMQQLADTTHQVITAIALTNASAQKCVSIETQVCFGPLSKHQIDWYWQTGEPQDKAGGYGIQGLGGQFVKHINGSYSAVVGLPLYQTRNLLTEFGLINEC